MHYDNKTIHYASYNNNTLRLNKSPIGEEIDSYAISTVRLLKALQSYSTKEFDSSC